MDKTQARRIKRIQKSKINTTVTLVTSIVMGVLSFFERSVFNHCFIADYLGLYSFYYNVIGILSTIELGLMSAISFALYAPIEYQQYDQIAAIMKLFKRAYIVLGTIILIVGLALFPVLEHLTNTEIPIELVQFYFLFFLGKTVINFYFGYKGILVTANQNQYKITLLTNSIWSILYLAEMIISITTGNFFYYVLAIFIADTIRALLVNLLGRLEFPMLGKYKNAKLKKDTIRVISRNIKGLMITRLSSVLVSSTDSILISAMVGTAFLGKYSNYQMLITGLLSISALIPKSIGASIGNAGVTERKRDLAKSFESLNLGSFLIYGFFTILLINVINPIVSLFFGADRTIGMFSVILICINFYLTNQREIILTFKGSLGLYWEDRKRPLIEGLTNLIVSIALGKYWGFDGIIIGTIISQVCVNLVIEPRVIYHQGLRSSAFWYYITVIGRFILTLAVAIICFVINSYIPFTGITEISTKAISTSLITIFIFYLVYRNDENAVTIVKTLKIAFMDKRKLKKLEKADQE